MMDALQVAHWQRIRDYNARTWRAARRILFSLPAEEWDRLLAEWQAAPYPAGAASFADFLWQRTGGRGEAIGSMQKSPMHGMGRMLH